MSIWMTRIIKAWRALGHRRRFLGAIASAITLPLAVRATENTPSGVPDPRMLAAKFPLGIFRGTDSDVERMTDPFAGTATTPVSVATSPTTPASATTATAAPAHSLPSAPDEQRRRVKPPRLLPPPVAPPNYPGTTLPAPPPVTQPSPGASAPSDTESAVSTSLPPNTNHASGYPLEGEFRQPRAPIGADTSSAPGVQLGPDVGVVSQEIWGDPAIPRTAPAQTSSSPAPDPAVATAPTQDPNSAGARTAGFEPDPTALPTRPSDTTSSLTPPQTVPPPDATPSTPTQNTPTQNVVSRVPAAQATAAHQDAASRVLAIVGDQPILAGDMLGGINESLKPYEGKVPEEMLNQEREKRLQAMLPSAISTKLAAVDFLRKIPPDKVVEVEAKAYKHFSENRLPELLQKSGTSTAAELDEKLRQMGSSLDKLRRMHTEQIMASAAYGQNLTLDYEPNLLEMLEYYRDHAAEYRIAERVRWQQLTVRFDRSPSRKEAWATLAEMGNSVKGGATWESVAQRSSHGPTASSGGSYPWTERGTLASESIEKTLFELPVNEMSRMFEDRDGFHIIRVIEHQPEGRVEFQEVQDKIKEAIVDAHRKLDEEKYLERLRKETYVWTIYDQPANSGSSAQVAQPPGDARRF